MASFLETLVGDIEHIAESDLPSASDVRGVLAALVKRVEQLAGIGDTTPPTPPPGADPTPLPPGAPVESDLTILTQLKDLQAGTITADQLGPNAAKDLADAGGNIAAAIAARQAKAPAPVPPSPDSAPADPNALEIATLKARLASLGAS